MKFQAFCHLNWLWLHLWSQRQTQSHWTHVSVSQCYFLISRKKTAKSYSVTLEVTCYCFFFFFQKSPLSNMSPITIQSYPLKHWFWFCTFNFSFIILLFFFCHQCVNYILTILEQYIILLMVIWHMKLLSI